jgi:hypothetical protein
MGVAHGGGRRDGIHLVRVLLAIDLVRRHKKDRLANRRFNEIG